MRTLALKLTTTAAVIALVFGIGDGIAMSQVLASRSRVNTYAAEQAQLSTLAGSIASDFNAWESHLNLYLLTALTHPHAHQLIATAYQQATQAAARLDTDIQHAEQLPSTPAIHTDLARVARAAQAYGTYASEMHAAVLAGNVSRAVYSQTVGSLAPANDSMAALANLTHDTTAFANQALNAARAKAADAALWTELSLGLLVALLAAGVVEVRAYVLRPLRDLNTSLLALANGTSEIQHLDESREDEFGELARAFNRFRDRVQMLVGRVAESVGTLLDSTQSLMAVAGKLSDGAHETAERAHHTDAVSKQVHDNIQSVSIATEQMRLAIGEIARSAADAANVASNAVEVATSTQARVQTLGESSDEIGMIIETITTIANQTNLLALNAAIEAARAGEAGKGFAVVANEVKDLARNTARATKEIGTKLEAIRAESLAAVEAIGHITEVIATINDLQSSIASAVEEQSVTTNEISRVVELATSGTSEIATAVTAVAESSNEALRSVDSAGEVLNRLYDIAKGLGTFVNHQS